MYSNQTTHLTTSNRAKESTRRSPCCRMPNVKSPMPTKNVPFRPLPRMSTRMPPKRSTTRMHRPKMRKRLPTLQQRPPMKRLQLQQTQPKRPTKVLARQHRQRPQRPVKRRPVMPKHRVKMKFANYPPRLPTNRAAFNAKPSKPAFTVWYRTAKRNISAPWTVSGNSALRTNRTR